mgnify:FL=1
MANLPLPSGYDVYWEKWIDAFEQEDSQLEEEIQEMQELLANEEGIDEDLEIVDHSVSHIRSIVTPFGILPLTEQTKASSHFKLWVGHSNFKLTEDFYKVIGQQPGIEALDILTPYRFRIAVGKMFVDRDVMKDVRDTMVTHVTDENENDEQE